MAAQTFLTKTYLEDNDNVGDMLLQYDRIWQAYPFMAIQLLRQIYTKWHDDSILAANLNNDVLADLSVVQPTFARYLFMPFLEIVDELMDYLGHALTVLCSIGLAELFFDVALRTQDNTFFSFACDLIPPRVTALAELGLPSPTLYRHLFTQAYLHPTRSRSATALADGLMASYDPAPLVHYYGMAVHRARLASMLPESFRGALMEHIIRFEDSY